MRNVIDPGDNGLDEGFGVILDFLDRHSLNIGQIGPKPQEAAQGSPAHFPFWDLLGPADRRSDTFQEPSINPPVGPAANLPSDVDR